MNMGSQESTYTEVLEKVHDSMKNNRYVEYKNSNDENIGEINIWFEKESGEYDSRAIQSIDLSDIIGWTSEIKADDEYEAINIKLTRKKKPLLYRIKALFSKGE